MDELQRLTKRVDELESLVKALLSGDARVVQFASVPIENVVLGQGCQVTLNNCPTGQVFLGDQDAIEEAESRLEEMAGQADELEGMLDDLEDRLEDLTDRMEEINSGADGE